MPSDAGYLLPRESRTTAEVSEALWVLFGGVFRTHALVKLLEFRV